MLDRNLFVIIRDHPKYAINAYGEILNISTNKFLHPFPTARGGLRVNLNGECKLVHRLVYETFSGQKSGQKYRIGHFDGAYSNNFIENLQIL